jgi:3-oxoacyl-[acyl-carrier protein] reductase
MSGTPRTAIVTGASKGIGAALATRLAADGFQTIVNYASSAAEAEEVVAAIAAGGGCAMAIHADVTDAGAMKALFDQAEKAFGPVDQLVNDAGIIKLSPLAQVADEEFVERLIADIPLGRLGQPDDVARIVSFLAGSESGWVNSQIIKANGGRN